MVLMTMAVIKPRATCAFQIVLIMKHAEVGRGEGEGENVERESIYYGFFRFVFHISLHVFFATFISSCFDPISPPRCRTFIICRCYGLALAREEREGRNVKLDP